MFAKLVGFSPGSVAVGIPGCLKPTLYASGLSLSCTNCIRSETVGFQASTADKMDCAVMDVTADLSRWLFHIHSLVLHNATVHTMALQVVDQ